MWELKSDGIPHQIRFHRVSTPCRCAICGQYLKPDDRYYIVACNGVPEATVLDVLPENIPREL